MFNKHKVYYSVEMKTDDNSYIFICSYSSFNEAKEKVEELKSTTGNEYRILRIEKDIEEVS